MVADTSLTQAGLSGRAEAQLVDVHGRTRSADAVTDELNLMHCGATGKDVAV
jgi:hypothetical protein